MCAAITSSCRSRSFGRPVLLIFLPFVAILAALAIWRRDLLASWLGDHPAMRAGLIGAAVATAIGTLANDSGALLLVIGAAYLLAFAAYAWAEAGRPVQPRVEGGVGERRGTPSPQN